MPTYWVHTDETPSNPTTHDFWLTDDVTQKLFDHVAASEGCSVTAVLNDAVGTYLAMIDRFGNHGPSEGGHHTEPSDPVESR
jgi:hypothetical protein